MWKIRKVTCKITIANTWRLVAEKVSVKRIHQPRTATLRKCHVEATNCERDIDLVLGHPSSFQPQGTRFARNGNSGGASWKRRLERVRAEPLTRAHGGERGQGDPRPWIGGMNKLEVGPTIPLLCGWGWGLASPYDRGLFCHRGPFFSTLRSCTSCARGQYQKLCLHWALESPASPPLPSPLSRFGAPSGQVQHGAGFFYRIHEYIYLYSNTYSIIVLLS